MSVVVKQHDCKERNEEEKFAALSNVIENYERKESNLIQILHMAQVIFGFLPEKVQYFIAEQMDLPISKVSGVVTFYTFFQRTLKAAYHYICLATACYVRGERFDKIKET